MALWAAFALMTGAAVFAVLLSLARSRGVAVEAEAADLAVYRDQMDEIARDRDRGLIGDREAEAARAEVGRRLLATPGSSRRGDTAGDDRRRRIAAFAALVGVPAIALGGYAALGRPELPDRPLAERRNAAPDVNNVAELVSRVEAALEKNPDDVRGWQAVAPIYLRVGRPADAARAYANVIRIAGSSPEREADHGEALFAAADGVVTPEARAAFERSISGDAPSVKGAVYLSRAAEQDGDIPGALARLKGLLQGAAPDAPYRGALMAELERLAAAPSMPLPEGSAEVERKTPEERLAMVRGMVDGLGERLSRQGGDLGEWLRLVKARAALGDADQARAALAEARGKFGGDGRAAARLEALALGLGLEGRGA